MRAAGISGLVAPQARPHDDPRAGRPRRRRPRRAQFRPGRAERALGRRHHLPPDLGGLALSRRRPGRLLAGGSSAGRWPTTCAPSSSSTRCRWPSGRRRPAPGLIHHSDQGCNTCRWPSARPPATPASPVSMGSKGDCYDNAVAESFFATLKKELVHRRSWPTRRELHVRGLRVHRGLLQPPPPALDARLSSRPPSFENRTLIATTVLASPLRGSHPPVRKTSRSRPKAQPCPAKRGNSTDGVTAAHTTSPRAERGARRPLTRPAANGLLQGSPRPRRTAAARSGRSPLQPGRVTAAAPEAPRRRPPPASHL